MLEALHVELAEANHGRLAPTLDDASWRMEIDRDYARRILEGNVLELERARIVDRAANAPSGADAFIAWYEALKENGPGQNDPLFPWLAEHASADEMRWFLHQEVAGEAGFEDLLALTQLRLDTRPKLELARNFWDEMGRGSERGMHGPMLTRLADALELSALAPHVPIVWESLALGNIMLGLASNRRYAYQALGALGVIELTAPWRAQHVDAGLKRLGIAPHARHYFALHATLDVKHSAAWNAEVLHPIVASEPRAARAIAEGALLRLDAGRRCFVRYRRELGTQPSAPSAAKSASRSLTPMSLR
jgi:hypothetical protein